MRAPEIWSEVHRTRLELADGIESLTAVQWDAPSWCPGWRVRDVLAHVVHIAEATQVSMIRDVLRGGGRPDRAFDRIARQLGDVPVPDLVRSGTGPEVRGQAIDLLLRMANRSQVLCALDGPGVSTLTSRWATRPDSN